VRAPARRTEPPPFTPLVRERASHERYAVVVPSVALLQVRIHRIPPVIPSQDPAVITFHLRSDAPEFPVDEATAVEGVMTTFLTVAASLVHEWVIYDQYRWYHLDAAGETTGPPFRVTEINVPGTASSPNAASPQTAITVTEKTAMRLRWGRFYLPLTNISALTSSGRLQPATADALADAADSLYSTVNAGPTSAAFCSRPRPDGTFQLIAAIQVDDLVDVIRRRRWDVPSLREVRDVTS
jgi:hypothetical protein